MTSVQKMKKRSDERKRSKEASAISKIDILDAQSNPLQSVLKKRDIGDSRGAGRSRGWG